ncbi:hypothetical protein BDW71DRAFT_192715 [Aspergillus fruticulosus]
MYGFLNLLAIVVEESTSMCGPSSISHPRFLPLGTVTFVVWRRFGSNAKYWCLKRCQPGCPLSLFSSVLASWGSPGTDSLISSGR